jgi:glyoxylase-like metal-dependent hydrolase (beta-lactamase superfamily II)
MGSAMLESVRDKRIDLIINSHFHVDHISNNKAFANAQVWAHRLDAPAIRHKEMFLEHYGITSVSNGKLQPFRLLSEIPESPVHHEFEDNESICLGEVELRVIHTPGHTPGHCSFLWPDEGILYGGDIDLTENGPFYGNFTSNIDDFISSIRKLRDLNPRIFVSAHMELIEEDIPGCLDRYLRCIYEREARILDSLATSSTLEELTLQKPITGGGGKPEQLFYQVEMIGIYNHLERLIAGGSVVRDGDYYVRA